MQPKCLTVHSRTHRRLLSPPGCRGWRPALHFVVVTLLLSSWLSPCSPVRDCRPAPQFVVVAILSSSWLSPCTPVRGCRSAPQFVVVACFSVRAVRLRSPGLRPFCGCALINGVFLRIGVIQIQLFFILSWLRVKSRLLIG